MADNKTKIVISAEDRASGAIKGITTQLQGLVAPVAGLSAAFAGLASAVGGLSLAAFVKDAVAVGSKLNDLSIATGATVEQLSAMTDIAELADVGLDQVAIGLQKLSKNMVDAASGGKQSADVFKALGVSIRDGAGNIRDSGEMMQSVAKAIAGLSSGTERAAAAQLAFGKSGAQLLPMMKDLAEAGELQSRWTTEQADLADRVGDNFTRLGQAYRHLGEEIGKTALPALRDFSEVMVEAASAPGSLAAGIRQMAQDGTLKEWAEGGALAVAALVDVLRAAAGGVEAVGKGIAAAAALLGARSPEQAKAIIAAFGKDFDRIWNQEQLVDKLKARFAQLPAEMAKAAASAGGTGFADLLDKENRKIAKSVDEFARLMERLNAKDAGLDASFWKDLATLHDAYDKGRIGIEAYRAAVEKLVTQQKFHQDALAASAKAEKEWADAANRAAEAGRRSLESLQEKARAAEEELATYGLTRSEIESTIIARLEEQRAVAAAADNEHALVEALDAEIEARRRLRDASRGLEAREASRKAIDDQAKAWENFSRDIEQSLTDALMRSFEAGDNFGEAFVKTLQNTLKTAALKLAVQVVMQPVMGSMGQALGYTQGGAGGGGLGGMSNIFSPISNIATTSIGGSAFGAGMLSGVSESLLGASFVGPSASLAGNASIAAGAAFGSFLPAIGIGLGLLSLFGGDLFGGKEKPPEINIANVPKGTKWAVSAGAGPFGELQMAGKHLGETEQEVQKMVDGLLKPIIAADTALSAYLTKGEVGSISSALSGWSSGEVEFESEQQIHDLVNARLAVISDTIGGWVDELADTVTGTSEEVYNALGQILSVRGVEGAEAIARELLDGAEGAFAETGESVAQTLVRLVSSLDAFNTAAESLGWTTQEMTAAWGEAASELMTAFGGREGFATAIAGYYERYYSDAEKLANVTRLVQEQFDKLGLTMPDTKDQFRALVESFDPMTEAGREAVVGLLKVEEAFTKVAAGAVDAAREVAADRRDFVAARRAQQDAERLAAVPAFSGTAGEYNYLTAMEQVRAGNFGVTRSGEFAGYVRNELSSGMSKALSNSLHDALDFATTQTIEQRYASPLDRAASAYSMALSGRDIDAYKDAMADIGRAFATGAIGADDYARGLAAIADWFADTIPVVDDLAAQMQRVEGAAYMLGRTGLETIASEFGAIGEEAKRLAAAAAEAQEPIAQATDAIARLSGTSAQLGRGSAAAYYGFSEGGVEGRMMLDASMGTIRTASVISLAANMASQIMTTAEAARAAEQLSGNFTGVARRDAGMLLGDLREYDSASFERAFTRINDAFIKGQLDEDQYAELFDVAVKTFEGPNTEAEKLAQNFMQLSEAAGSLADALRVGKDTTYMIPAQRFAEATRQYLDDLTGARGGSMKSMRELERSSRVYLDAARENARDATEYRTTSARAIAAIASMEREGATMEEVVAEIRALRDENRSLRAALEAGQALGIKQSRRTADIVEKWDAVGMPATAS